MATAFATSADLILQYDVRRVCELASDTGSPLLAAALSSNTVITYVLARATEMILMNARLGKRYSETELVTLATSSDSVIGTGIRGLCCDLAYGLLVMRRGTGQNDMSRLSPAFIAAQQTLALLARGDLVFPHTDTEEQIAAGTPETSNITLSPNYPNRNQSWSQEVNFGLLPISPFTSDPYTSF